MRRVLPAVVGLLVGLAAGFVLGRAFPPRPVTIDLELSVVAPGDEARQAVLRYRGADYDSALAGGNISPQAGRLDGVVAVDEKDPRSGVIWWRGFGVRREGGGEGTLVFSGMRDSHLATELRVHRVDKDGERWELSEDSARRVAAELARPK